MAGRWGRRSRELRHLVGELVFGQHVQAGRQHSQVAGEQAQLSLLGLAGEAGRADDVTPLHSVVQRLESVQVQLRQAATQCADSANALHMSCVDDSAHLPCAVMKSCSK